MQIKTESVSKTKSLLVAPRRLITDRVTSINISGGLLNKTSDLSLEWSRIIKDKFLNISTHRILNEIVYEKRFSQGSDYVNSGTETMKLDETQNVMIYETRLLIFKLFECVETEYDIEAFSDNVAEMFTIRKNKSSKTSKISSIIH
jgi:hypothetical protein